MTTTLVFHLLDFVKAFELECDASGVVIGGVLSQESHLITFLSEKWKEANNAMGRQSGVLHVIAVFASLTSLFTI